MKHPHTWDFMRVISRRWCTRCGLVWLRNERSNQAAKQPCKWWDE